MDILTFIFGIILTGAIYSAFEVWCNKGDKIFKARFETLNERFDVAVARINEAHRRIDALGRIDTRLPMIQWRCKRCNTFVDMTIKRCKCTESPSPWEMVIDGQVYGPEARCNEKAWDLS